MNRAFKGDVHRQNNRPHINERYHVHVVSLNQKGLLIKLVFQSILPVFSMSNYTTNCLIFIQNMGGGEHYLTHLGVDDISVLSTGKRNYLESNNGMQFAVQGLWFGLFFGSNSRQRKLRIKIATQPREIICFSLKIYCS